LLAFCRAGWLCSYQALCLPSYSSGSTCQNDALSMHDICGTMSWVGWLLHKRATK
jgi:hypothetical protein